MPDVLVRTELERQIRLKTKKVDRLKHDTEITRSELKRLEEAIKDVEAEVSALTDHLESLGGPVSEEERNA